MFSQFDITMEIAVTIALFYEFNWNNNNNNITVCIIDCLCDKNFYDFYIRLLDIEQRFKKHSNLFPCYDVKMNFTNLFSKEKLHAHHPTFQSNSKLKLKFAMSNCWWQVWLSFSFCAPVWVGDFFYIKLQVTALIDPLTEPKTLNLKLSIEIC